MRCLAILLLAGVSWSQDQPPVPPAPPQAPATPPVLTNTGKPMTLPFQCTAEDIRSAGLDCTEDDPCPVYLELSLAESSGIRIFAAGNIHTASATLYSVLLGTDDNGQSWREVFDRVRGASLDRIQFSGTDSAWVSGGLVYPLPHDPFLIVTSDGGKSWRQTSIFSEPGLGAIQQFSFDDSKTGALIVDHGAASDDDRYELYESLDGGDSWTIKETSVKPLKLKRAPPAPAAEWRVRADAPTKSYHVEHRQGTRWLGVGAFSVSLGVCKPPE